MTDKKTMSRKTMSKEEFDVRGRRSFLTGLGAAAIGMAGLTRINTGPVDNNIPAPLRTVHEANASIWQGLFRETALEPTFDPSLAEDLIFNGRHGILDSAGEEIPFDPDNYTVEIAGPDGAVLATHTIDEIKALPFVEMTVVHKCIEGWSQIVTWGGTPFSNLAALYNDAAQAPIVGLETPDNGYYVSLDRASMLHPQTMLTWELNGEPLTARHGAPLRLSTPVKYGIKQIKRIGRIQFADERTPDYWEERGYDWYAGL